MVVVSTGCAIAVAHAFNHTSILLVVLPSCLTLLQTDNGRIRQETAEEIPNKQTNGQPFEIIVWWLALSLQHSIVESCRCKFWNAIQNPLTFYSKCLKIFMWPCIYFRCGLLDPESLRSACTAMKVPLPADLMRTLIDQWVLFDQLCVFWVTLHLHVQVTKGKTHLTIH